MDFFGCPYHTNGFKTHLGSPVLLFRKNTSRTRIPAELIPVELKSVDLLVMKKIWNLVNLVCKKMSQVCKIMFKQIVPMWFQCFLKALEWNFDNLFESNLWTRDIVCWGFPDSPLWYRHYMQAVIVFQCFFCSLPSELVYYFRRIYTMWFLPHLFCHHYLFTFQKFCAL